MEEKKKRKRRAYLDSFHKDSSGNYVYQGDLYAFEPQEKELRHVLAQQWLSAGVMLAALLVTGRKNTPLFA